MARGIGARRSSELYGGLLGDYLMQAGGLLAERAGEVISGQALEEYIQSLIPGFGTYEIVDGQITFPEARAPQGGSQGLLGEMLPGGGVAGTIAGVGAKTADRGLLAIAEEAEQRGLPQERIFDATGWFRGADGKWRFEIDDSASIFNSLDRIGLAKQELARRGYDSPFALGNPKTPRFEQEAAYGFADNKLANQRVKDALSHEPIFDAYPSLDQIRLKRYAPDTASVGYATEREVGIEYPRMGDPPQKELSTALHEMEHVIQRKEGFARGGTTRVDEMMDHYNTQVIDILAKNPDTEKAFNEYIKVQNKIEALDWSDETIDALEKAEENLLSKNGGKLLRDAYYAQTAVMQQTKENFARDYYRRLAGEVEARNVQKRMGLLADDRRMLPPWMTEDVPRDQQIIRFE